MEKIEMNKPYYTQALTELTPELLAMRTEDVLPIRHDITSAAMVATGALKEVRLLRESVRARFGEEAVRYIDRLEVVARACLGAHAAHLTSMHGADVEETAGRLMQVRSVMTIEVQALIGQGLVPASALGELVGGTSYKGLCIDVLQLVAILRRVWSSASSRTGVTLAELDRAESLANAFTTALGEEHVSGAGSATADMRRRAYTLLVRTYEEVRRQVSFLHWKDGRANEIAPPLGDMTGSTVSISTGGAVQPVA